MPVVLVRGQWIKWGKTTRDARVNSPQPGRRLRGGKVTGRRETGHWETG